MWKIGNFVPPKKRRIQEKKRLIYLIQKTAVFLKYLTNFSISDRETGTIVPE